jgi:hypothetical protein
MKQSEPIDGANVFVNALSMFPHGEYKMVIKEFTKTLTEIRIQKIDSIQDRIGILIPDNRSILLGGGDSAKTNT